MSTKAVRGSVASLVWCPLTGLDQDKGGDLWGCQYSLYNGSCPSALGLLPGSQLDLFIVACSHARLRLEPRKRAEGAVCLLMSPTQRRLGKGQLRRPLGTAGGC